MKEEKTTTTTPTSNAKENNEKKNLLGRILPRHYGRIDLIMAGIGLLCLIGIQATNSVVLGWILFGLGALSLAIPPAIDKVRERSSFGLSQALQILRRAGVSPSLVDGEIHWTGNGKQNILRVFNGGLLQVAREYPLIKRGVLDCNEKAALNTMKEICSVKVGVRRDDENRGSLVFSAESLCPSSKCFKQVFANYIQALDLAEQRQSVHLRELAESPAQRPRIGFNYLPPTNEEDGSCDEDQKQSQAM